MYVCYCFFFVVINCEVLIFFEWNYYREGFWIYLMGYFFLKYIIEYFCVDVDEIDVMWL